MLAILVQESSTLDISEQKEFLGSTVKSFIFVGMKFRGFSENEIFVNT